MKQYQSHDTDVETLAERLRLAMIAAGWGTKAPWQITLRTDRPMDWTMSRISQESQGSLTERDRAQNSGV